jgi:pimeloyl-ACP methyl ester carboxylesterase
VSTFVLVHGAYHGAWCWDLLAPELRGRGHEAIAMDLPCDDARAGFDAYRDAVLDAMGDATGDDVCVVGHSLGGFTAPLVAAVRPVGHLVFLCTAPVLGTLEAETIRSRMVAPELAAAPRFRDDLGRAVMAAADARRCFFDDLDPGLADWAVARLRPQGARPMLDPWPVAAWPHGVRRHVIVTRHDRAVSHRAALEAGRHILEGAEPTSLDGGHSPFLSRPGELAATLAELCR